MCEGDAMRCWKRSKVSNKSLIEHDDDFGIFLAEAQLRATNRSLQVAYESLAKAVISAEEHNEEFISAYRPYLNAVRMHEEKKQKLMDQVACARRKAGADAWPQGKESMRCPSCGALNSAQGRFCVNCGSMLKSPDVWADLDCPSGQRLPEKPD